MKKKDVMDEIDDRVESSRLFALAHQISESNYFLGFMGFAIVANTIVLSLDQYPVNQQRNDILEKVNYFFLIIFAMEMLIKMLAVGVKNYFIGSAFNTFDCLIVLASFIDIFLANFLVSKNSDSSGSVITALRGFRLLRVFKLAKSWKRFELLLETLGRTLVDIATFTVLLFIFIFTYTLFGLEVFGFKAKLNPYTNEIDNVNGISPDNNFDTFLDSFTTVFMVLTNESMSEIFYNYYRTVGAAVSTIFFISLVIIG